MVLEPKLEIPVKPEPLDLFLAHRLEGSLCMLVVSRVTLDISKVRAKELVVFALANYLLL
jgi:hypothetical protein